MITKNKVSQMFCIIDDFCNYFDQKNGSKLLLGSSDKPRCPAVPLFPMAKSSLYIL